MSREANKRKPHEAAAKDIPVDAIREIAKVIPECSVTIKRRNAKGHMATVAGQTGIVMQTLDLLDMPKIVAERGLGGGQPFLIEARNPMGDEPYYAAKFELWVEGAPLQPRAGVNSPAGSDPHGSMMTPWGPMPSMPFGTPQPPSAGGVPPAGGSNAWAQGLAPNDRAGFQESQMRFPPYPYPHYAQAPQSSVPSDALALRELSDLKRQLGEMNADLKAAHKRNEEMQQSYATKLEEMRRDSERRERELKEQHQRDLAAERERREEERRRQDERDRQQQQQMFEARIAAATENKSNPVMDMMMLMMKEQQGKSSSEMQMQMKLAELSAASQKEQFAALMQLQQANKGSDELALKLLEQKSPAAQAELLGTIMEMQMTMTGAMMNLVNATAGEDPPPWLQMAMAGLQGVQNLAEKIGENMTGRGSEGPMPSTPARRLSPPPQQSRALPSPVAPPVIEVPDDGAISMGVVEVDDEGQVAEEPSAELALGGAGDETEAVTPEEIAEEVSEAMAIENPEREAVEAEVDRMGKMLPADFRTVEWRTILVELHLQSDVEKTGDMIAMHLGHLMRFRGLPDALGKLREDPKGTLGGLLKWLPISGKAPQYVDQVLDAVVSYLVQDGWVAAGSGEEAQPE